MQAAVAQRVRPTNQLYDFLKVYLNRKNRLQPIIGLGSITECVTVGTPGGEVLYVCDVCTCRLGKADVQSHIIGSLHRYNYIKTCHLHLLSEWKEEADLSKLAWPLMEKAKLIEEKEGPGDVQLLEVEDADYQRMAAWSETDAVTLVGILKDGQGAPDSHSETAPVQPDSSPTQLPADEPILGSSAQTRECEDPFGAPEETSEDSTAAPGTAVFSGSRSRSSFFDSYRGPKSLIGLFYVAEFRSEDDRTFSFLCHTCCVRINKWGIIDHLTNSSHILNYMMQTHPEQLEGVTHIIGNHQFLQSLAKEVEQQEGRGELMVVYAPESFCQLVISKSYNWCLKHYWKRWTYVHFKNKSKGVCVRENDSPPHFASFHNSTFLYFPIFQSLWVQFYAPQGKKRRSYGPVPQKCGKLVSMERGMTRNTSNTVFKVNLPLTDGALLLERTTFSTDGPLLSPTSPPPCDVDFTWAPDCDTAAVSAEHTSVWTSHLEQEPSSGEEDAGEYVEPEKDSAGHHPGGYFSHKQYFDSSEHIPQPAGGGNAKTQYSPEGSERERLFKERQTHSEWLPSAAGQAQGWPSYSPPYGYVEGGTHQWYASASYGQVATRVEVPREEQPWVNSSASPYAYQQHPSQYQQTPRYHAGHVTCGAWQHGWSGEFPRFDAGWMNTRAQLAEPWVHGGDTASQPRTWPTSMRFTTDQTTPPVHGAAYMPPRHPSQEGLDEWLGLMKTQA